MPEDNKAVMVKKEPSSSQRARTVTILQEDNFGVWKWNLKYNLKTLGLYDTVTTKNVINEENDNQAMFEIISTLGEKVKSRVSHCKTAFELYEAIEAIYTNKTSFQITSLNMKLSNFKFKSVDAIGEGLNEIQNIVTKIKNLGDPISDKMVEGVILSALPPSFRTFVTVWKGINENERTLPNLMNRITAEIEDNKLFNVREDKALVAKFKNFKVKNAGRPKPGKFQKKQNQNTNNEGKGNSKKLTCNYCKKQGHAINECRKLQRKREAEGNKPRDNKDDLEKGEKEKPVAFMAAQTTPSYKWIADSGASKHMTSHREWFQNYYPLEKAESIRLGNDELIEAIGIGDIKTTHGTLQDVYYVPKMGANLFSIVAATQKGCQAQYDEQAVWLIKDEEIVLRGYLEGNLYVFNLEIIIDKFEMACVARTVNDWHQRLGHVSHKIIKQMAETKAAEGFKVLDIESEIKCIDCARNKGHAVSHQSKTTEKTIVSGACLHIDTVGPFEQQSLGGSLYFVLCKDEATSYRKAAFVKYKSDIPSSVKTMITDSEYETGHKLLRLVSDNGTEFVNNELSSFLKQRGVNHVLSAPYTPQQNGLIERDIRTVVESARTMLNKANLPRKLWAESVSTAIYILNRVPTTKNPFITPYELWFNRRPNLKNLRIFGQNAIVNTPIQFRDGKWDFTGNCYKLVGYTQLYNTYKFYCPEKDRIFISCNAIFMDNYLQPEIDGFNNSFKEQNDSELVLDQVRADIDSNLNQSTSSGKTYSVIRYSDEESESGDQYQEPMSHNEVQHTCNQRSSTPKKQMAIPRKLNIFNRPPEVLPSRMRGRRNVDYTAQDPFPNESVQHAKLSTIEASEDPSSYQAAMKRTDKHKWLEAMQDEMNSLYKNKVWTLVERPKNINIVSNRWVLRIKRKPNGDIDRYRARLVARGFSQVLGVDYNETFSPVVNMVSIRMLLAYAAIEGLQMKQFDVKTAFLYGNLEETVYMEQPEGFSDKSDRVCLLEKSLYGLKQAPRQWNKEFSNFLTSLNLQESENDRCIYYRTRPTRIFIAIYVDDGIIFAENFKDIFNTIKELKRRFDIHEVETSTFLGFQIEIDGPNEISIHQESYIRKILQKFNMQNASSIDNPSTITKNTKDELESKPLGEEVPYREAIGSLMYASTTCRLDIAYAVNKTSRKVADPTTFDWQCVKRIMRYLKDKEDGFITFSKEANDGLMAYCDSDFAGDESNKSTSGYIVLFGGGPIQWKSQRQSLVTLSSTEAELVCICSTVKELVWIRDLALELGFISDAPLPIYCDNESAIKLATNEKSVQRTRHMGTRAAYTREKIQEKVIEVKHVATQNQLADFLTKPLTSNRFKSIRDKLMYFLTILTLMMCTMARASLMESTKPIIWLPTNHFIDDGITEYEIYFTVLNPCLNLQQNFGLNDNLSKVSKREEKYVNETIFSWKRQLMQVPPQNPQQFPQQNIQNHIIPQTIQAPNQIPPNQVMSNQVVPNPVIPIDMFNVQDQNDELIAIRTIEECNYMFKLVYMTKLDELVSKAQTRSGMSRHTIIKKGVVGDAAEAVADVVCTACVSNLLSTILSYVNPNSDHNKISRIDDRVRDQNKKIDEFNHNFNITQQVQRGILDSLTAFGRTIADQQRQISHIANLLPRITWISAYLQSRITAAGADLKIIIEKFAEGHVAVRAMRDMINLQSLEGVEDQDTKFQSIDRISPDIIRFRFAVREKSRNTFVYKVNPFIYWDNLTGLPSLMEYQGEKFLMFNESNNCLKALEEPSQRAILEDCKEANYTDPRLQIWRSLVKTSDLYAYNNTCQAKRTMDFHYIYCFPFNITLKTGPQKAPPYVFRLPINEPFKIMNRIYTPIKRKINITSRIDLPAIDSIHLGHFPMGSEMGDQSKWFDELQRLRKLNEEIEIEKERSVFIAKGGATWWIIIVLFIILTCLSSGLILYNLYMSDINMRHQERIRADLTELKSNYGEIKPDCVKCILSQSSSTNHQKDKEKSRIEVGRDESITINLNRPLPVPPLTRERSL